MDHPRGCQLCEAEHGVKGTVALAGVRDEVDQLEAEERKIGWLMAALRATLTPEQFKLVWALKDAEETVGLAHCLMSEQRFVEALARHLPAAGPQIRAAARHVTLGPDSPSPPRRGLR